MQYFQSVRLQAAEKLPRYGSHQPANLSAGTQNGSTFADALREQHRQDDGHLLSLFPRRAELEEAAAALSVQLPHRLTVPHVQ